VKLPDLLKTETLPVDGYALAAAREPGLAIRTQQVRAARNNQPPSIAAILFKEDAGSILYTRLKKEAAARLGITYQVFEFSVADPVETVIVQVQVLNADPAITGIIIQKPARGQRDITEYKSWWQALVAAINPAKDVDGLTPSTLAQVTANTWQTAGVVLPATCRAVLLILHHYTRILELPEVKKNQFKIAILGKSELLGLPLAAELKNQKYQVDLLGRKEINALIEQKMFLHDFDLIVTATGQPKLITGEWLKPEAIVIDVGEPQGDVDATSAAKTASLITPVPGGVGPLTVSCLMENSLDLLSSSL
jgi:methylenetetrahydrofolate dehydrogenase (NADP+)/methenyltetrahydrofolate cyclohydrolase